MTFTEKKKVFLHSCYTCKQSPPGNQAMLFLWSVWTLPSLSGQNLSVYPRQQCYDTFCTERDSFLKDESIPISLGMWLLSKQPSCRQRFGRFQTTLKISPNMREGNENTTRGETSITSINVFSSKSIFPLVPALFIFYVFSLTKHFFEASLSDRYVSDN